MSTDQSFPERPLGEDLRSGIAELLRLAGPVIIARAGITLMAFVDAVMVGRYSSQELAYLAISLTMVQTLLIAGIGLVMGTQVMTATAFGGGNLHECGAVWRRGAPYGFGIGLIGLVICMFGQPILQFTGQNEDLARMGGEVIAVSGLGLPFVLFYVASAFFLEGIKRPLPGMLLIVAANILNVLFNWMLIYGNLGLPAMGAVGAAWGTNVVRVGLGLCLGIYVWQLRDHARLAIRQPAGGGWREWRLQRKIGYAAGLSIGIESATFNGLGIMAGWMGTFALGVHAIALNLLSFIAMIAIGLGSAAGIQVGFANGQKDYVRVRRAGWSGLGVGIIAAALIAIFLAVIPDWFSGLYTVDPALIDLARPVIMLLAAIVVFDGAQLVMNNVLRARGETWVISKLNMTAFLFVMIPLGWWLGVVQGRGVGGLYEAVFVACFVSMTMLTGYFFILCSRDRRVMVGRGQ